jgi:hypothetical protein
MFSFPDDNAVKNLRLPLRDPALAQMPRGRRAPSSVRISFWRLMSNVYQRNFGSQISNIKPQLAPLFNLAFNFPWLI